MTAAADIPLSLYRLTLFWPLTLDFDEKATGATLREIRDDEVKRLVATKVWTQIDDPLLHIPRPDGATGAADGAKSEKPESAALEQARHDARAYAEYAYFHDFVQHFLFKAPAEDRQEPPAFRLFQRKGVSGLRATIRDEGRERSFQFSVPRINLYLLDVGVAMLAVELHWSHSETSATLTLADVLALNDRLRRAHAPFLDRGEKDDLPDASPSKYTPSRMEWLGEPGFAGMPDDEVAGLAARLVAARGAMREIPPFSHWSWLINGEADEPLKTWRRKRSGERPEAGWIVAPAMSDGVTWRHVSDDRLPVLYTIVLPSVADYRAIGEGLWMRLCFVDAPGGDAYSYARRFLERDWEKHVYDRYHFQPDVVAQDSRDDPSRYLLCSYAFGAVGAGDFVAKHIAEHMRRHYFQLMLLAQMERAMLLSISSRVTRAVGAYEAFSGDAADSEEMFAQRLDRIERDLLQYVHRFRFTGVSSQLQGAELYDQLRERMALQRLYEDIKDELATATGFLSTCQQKRQANAQERLATIAALAVPPGLAFSFLGMNVLVSNEALTKMGLCADDRLMHGALVFAALSFFSALSGLAMWWFGRKAEGKSRALRLILAFSAASFVAAAALTTWREHAAPRSLLPLRECPASTSPDLSAPAKG